MRIALTVLMALHGFAHLVGFLVPWRLIEAEDTVYKTTLLAGRLDVGAAGIRLVGVAWLILAVAFMAAAAGAALREPWWAWWALVAAGTSLVLSAVSLPEAKIGVVVNVVILGALWVGPRLGWW